MHILFFIAAQGILKWNFDKTSLFPNSDALPVQRLSALLSDELSNIWRQMASSFLKLTQSILDTKSRLVVKWIDELLQIGEHCISIKLSFLLLVRNHLVESIFKILLNAGGQSCIWFVDCPLNFHKPRVPRFNVMSQDTCFIKIVWGNVEQVCSRERIN